MERYISVMYSYANDISHSWLPERLKIAETNLETWMGTHTKHSVIDFFNESDNKICYVKRLYGSRVECFYQILKETEKNSKIKNIIMNKSSIFSFGCGPAPEVAAYICYVREELKCKYHQLNITAVDCLERWGSFVDEVSYMDDYATIQFQAGLLSNEYLLNMTHSDICIMSYPHAMNFEDIWINLKEKFTLIIFIDQPQGHLIDLMKKYGFQDINFFFKASKTLFYYIDEKYDIIENNGHQLGQRINVLKCKRGIHDACFSADADINGVSIMQPCTIPINKTCNRGIHSKLLSCSSTFICEMEISSKFPCGHTFAMKCSDNEAMMIKTVKCNSICHRICERGIHDLSYTCESIENCENIVEIKRNCGHKSQIKCFQNEYDDLKNDMCEEIIEKRCARGLHKQMMQCSSPFVCEERIECNLYCGHQGTMECSDNEAMMIKTVKCNSICHRICERGLHDLSYTCGSIENCENIVEIELNCGHKSQIKCFQNECDDLKNDMCEEIIEKCCARGLHKRIMTCSSPFVCEERIECNLYCGHKGAMKCCDEISSIQCMEKVVKKCKRDIHKIQQECFKSNTCDIKCTLKLKCGCQKIVKCNNYEDFNVDTNCSNSCRMKAKELYILSRSKIGVKDTSDHEREMCGDILSDEICEEPCNKLLDCGHKCQWSCYLCLNGRLHRPCLEQCSRTLSCGHTCAGNCHQYSCEICVNNCLINKMKTFFQIKYPLTLSDQSKWSELLEPMINYFPVELNDMFERIIFNVKNERFSDNVVKNYNNSFKNIKNLLEYNETIISIPFPEVLKKYIDYVVSSINVMLKWLDPDSNKLAESSLDDFNMEFKRIKTVVTICQVAKLYIELNKPEISNQICEIFNKMKNEKYNEDAINNFYTKITEVCES